MLDVKTNDEEYSPTMKGTGATRMHRGKEDVNKLVNIFNQLYVFKHDDINVVCLVIRNITPPNVTRTLMSAPAQGKAKIKTFVRD